MVQILQNRLQQEFCFYCGMGELSAFEDETPYWRTLKANGELNAKYPNGIEAQKEKLEAEGHYYSKGVKYTVLCKEL